MITKTTKVLRLKHYLGDPQLIADVNRLRLRAMMDGHGDLAEACDALLVEHHCAYICEGVHA